MSYLPTEIFLINLPVWEQQLLTKHSIEGGDQAGILRFTHLTGSY
jgi:hypothetical protein